MKKGLFGFGLLLLLGACGSPYPETIDFDVRGFPPAGFILSDQDADDYTSLVEYVPVGESKWSYSQLYSMQIYHGMGNVTPEAYAFRLANAFNGICERVEITEPQPILTVQGYNAALWAVTCTEPLQEYRDRASGLDFKYHEFIMYYVIQGNNHLYVFQRVWHGDYIDPTMPPASHEAIQAWYENITSIQVCDPLPPATLCSAQ